MAEKKVVSKLVNQVTFQTDKAAKQRALADIKQVREAMRGISSDFKAIRLQNQAMKEQIRLTKQRTQAVKEYNRAGTKSDWLPGQRAGKSYTNSLRAQMRDQASMDKKHTQAIIEGRRRENSALGKLHAQALAEDARRTKAANRNNENLARSSSRISSMTVADRFGLTSRFGAKAGKRYDSIASSFRSGAIDARMYRQQVSALRRDLSAAANAQLGFNGTLKNMRSTFVQATASYTAVAGVLAAANVGKKMQGYQSGLQMAFGSKDEAANQMDWLKGTTRKYGLNFDTSAEGYSKIAVAGAGKLQTKDIQSLFEGYSAYAKASGTSNERTGLGLQAMTQMLS